MGEVPSVVAARAGIRSVSFFPAKAGCCTVLGAAVQGIRPIGSFRRDLGARLRGDDGSLRGDDVRGGA